MESLSELIKLILKYGGLLGGMISFVFLLGYNWYRFGDYDKKIQNLEKEIEDVKKDHLSLKDDIGLKINRMQIDIAEIKVLLTKKIN